ncbi:hypothetical protein [Geobacillus subterraneus]|uniref:Uncharacterized protein n=1 Tax=Geobacillus subterraneus TaxID=129338 RepID=A0A679FZ58_9BACL|nr:hypothetical protein [Geobacillus subterraneus]BBW98986.1 hypothetical protein GsuE55_38190 [Geobacillus subterraneus]
MREICVIESYDQLVSFLRELEKEFRLTDFEIVRRFVETPAFFRYHVELSMITENSYGRPSKLYLAVWGNEEDGYSLKFLWDTASDHEVAIVGEYWARGKANIKISIGEDESSNFYPTIIRLSKSVK